MAGHSKFKNIQHRKNAQDKKRSKAFTRVIREISTAVKSGSTDPNSNPRLRTALIAARAVNLPKDKIDKAIHSSENDHEHYDEIRYEGFASGGIAIIVEVSTSNRNRTASEVRSAFSKHGGSLGETGSVSFMFDHLGLIEYETTDTEAILEYAIEVGARDVEINDNMCTIYTEIHDYHEILSKMLDKFGQSSSACIAWIPQNKVMISDKEKAEKLLRLIDVFDDIDDVDEVYANYELSLEVEAALDKG